MSVDRNDWRVLGLLMALESLYTAQGALDAPGPSEHDGPSELVQVAIEGVCESLRDLGQEPGPVCDKGHKLVAMEFEGRSGPGKLWRCPECSRPEVW